MTENEIILEKQIADDLSAVLKEAKEMECKEVAYFRHIPLQNVETVIKALEEIQQYRAIGTVEEVRMLKDYKELYDAYNLIGTIEEFRNLKYKKNVLPIATIEFSKEDMQKIVDEKVAQIELDIQEIRAKAINEFATYMSDYIYENQYGCVDDLLYRPYTTMLEIAEQLKAGGIIG